MGYRSDVALVLSSDGLTLLEKYLEELFEKDKDTHEKVAEYFGEADVFRRDKNCNVFYLWRGVKWYDTDPDYAGPYHIEEFLDSTDLYGEDYLFIRLGEEVNDVETSGEMWSNPFGVGLRREIAFDDGPEL